MKQHVVSQREWLEARSALLEKEKRYTQLRDELTKERQALPWVLLEKPYTFVGESGEVEMSDLFANKTQLIIQHFMFEEDWEAGCKSCSFMADNINPSLVHLAKRDTAFAAVSIAPIEKLVKYKKRMGWDFQWVSSCESEFNRDFNVSFNDADLAAQSVTYNYKENTHFPCKEAPGLSVFKRENDGQIYHTYSVYGRGLEKVMTTYDLLDMVPKGRDEDGSNMAWLRRKDEYEE